MKLKLVRTSIIATALGVSTAATASGPIGKDKEKSADRPVDKPVNKPSTSDKTKQEPKQVEGQKDTKSKPTDKDKAAPKAPVEKAKQ